MSGTTSEGGALGALRVARRSGAEPFHAGGRALGFDLLDFWRWSASDLVSNATRGVLAEYLVARALGIESTGTREEWAAFDLVTASGVRIEVKSAAYLQTWHQTRPSTLRFTIRPTTVWDPQATVQSTEVVRRAHVYVFALLAHAEKRTIDPLDVAQWAFHVVPTSRLDEHHPRQKTLGMAGIERLGRRATYAELPAVFGEATAGLPPR